MKKEKELLKKNKRDLEGGDFTQVVQQEAVDGWVDAGGPDK